MLLFEMETEGHQKFKVSIWILRMLGRVHTIQEVTISNIEMSQVGENYNDTWNSKNTVQDSMINYTAEDIIGFGLRKRLSNSNNASKPNLFGSTSKDNYSKDSTLPFKN